MTDQDQPDVICLEERRLDRPALSIKKHSYCGHRYVELDAQTRMVHCRNCGALRDSFDVLLLYADRELRFYANDLSLKRQREELEVIVADLKRQARNARARLKRAKKKL